MEQCLRDFINELLESAGIMVQYITTSAEEVYKVDLGLRRDILGLPREKLDSMFKAFCKIGEDEVYHGVDVFQCNYYSCINPDVENGYIVIGPIIFEKITGRRFDELFEKLRLPEQLRTAMQNYYFSVSYVPFEASFDALLKLIFDYKFSKKEYTMVYYDESSMENWLAFYEGHFRVPDEPFKNIQYIEERYGYENSMMQAVRTGNLPEALLQLGKISSLMLPARLSNTLRDAKDLSITLNTNLRKSAEYGGVHPIHIDSLSNGHIKQIETMTSMEQLQTFQRKMVRHYCNLVKEYNLQDYSLPIRRVLTYINSDLTTDLSLKALAEELNVNASYLSSLFKKEMGMSLTEYVNTARITHAQILLYTTDQPIKNIALQCGISDMYYFSRMFKRITGVTPKTYRDKNMTLSMTR